MPNESVQVGPDNLQKFGCQLLLIESKACQNAFVIMIAELFEVSYLLERVKDQEGRLWEQKMNEDSQQRGRVDGNEQELDGMQAIWQYYYRFFADIHVIIFCVTKHSSHNRFLVSRATLQAFFWEKKMIQIEQG